MRLSETMNSRASIPSFNLGSEQGLSPLAKIKHKGVTGNIEFDAKGDIKDGTLTLYTYKGGKRQLLAVTK